MFLSFALCGKKQIKHESNNKNEKKSEFWPPEMTSLTIIVKLIYVTLKTYNKKHKKL